MTEPCEGCGKHVSVKGTERYVICDRCWNDLSGISLAQKPSEEPPDPELLALLPER
jgi:hypothetical protein